MTRTFVQAALAVLAFDLLASLASRASGFPYSYASVGSVLIYLAFCFLAGRKFGFGTAVGLGAFMGFTDATAGWALSYAIGPGRPEGEMTMVVWLFGLVGVMLMGVVCGLIGGAVGRFARRRHAA